MRVLSISSNQRKKTASSNNSGPSPFLGQRPRYSRYGAMQQPPQREQDQGRQVEVEEDEDIISFEPDFDEDDPLNDININKNQL